MLKKKFLMSLLSVSSLSVMSVNASATGIYVTGQLGYADTHMAAKTNLFHKKSKGKKYPGRFDQDVSAANFSNNGSSGRLGVGYQFNQNFALEVGYLYIPSKAISKTVALKEGTDGYHIGNLTGKLRQHAVDMLAKGILTITPNVQVYTKLGLAYLTSNIYGTYNHFVEDKESHKIIPGSGESKPVHNLNPIADHMWAPEASVGVAYNITSNVSVDMSWTHIQPIGKNRPSNIDFVAVGLGYMFGS